MNEVELKKGNPPRLIGKKGPRGGGGEREGLQKEGEKAKIIFKGPYK